MVCDALRVRLGETHLHLGRERKALHRASLRCLHVRGPGAGGADPRQAALRRLSGAGLSTESGIPDFRSRTGIWARYDPAQVATIDAFHADPERVWEFYSRRLALLATVEPNAGHLALAELERHGLVRAILTQNVDGLHQRAGSLDVVELHGSLGQAVCPACSFAESAGAVARQLETVNVPLCPRCGGVLKPGVVMFGEQLDAVVVERATTLARAAGVLVVVGSTLAVWPVAGLPLQAPAFAILNRGSTELDAHALVRVDAGARDTLSAVAALLVPASSSPG